MKKFFTLIAVAMMAVGAQAQKITFGADDVAAAGKVATTFQNGELKLTLVDEAGKMAIDANNSYFGTADASVKYTHRLKSGGKSQTSANKHNQVEVSVPAAGQLLISIRTASKDATDRTLVVTQNDNELYNQVVKDGDAIQVKGLDASDPDKDTNVFPVVGVNVVAGNVVLTWPVGALNIYAVEFVAGVTGINGVVAAPVSEQVYNIAGQKVSDGFKGLVVKNGKKVVVK